MTDTNTSNVFAQLGNGPGTHEGDVTVVFPNGGGGLAASADITVCADGVYGRLRDGRQFLCCNSGLVLVDVPQAEGSQ